MEKNQDNPTATATSTILVVDDEVSIINLCRALLEETGFTVLEAEGSSEALRLCTHHQGPIDLLITDLVLPPPGFQLASTSNQFPHVNGHELAVRATMIRSGLRIILMSGNPDKELASHGIKRGTLPFLAKPFEKDRLITLVHNVLAQPAPTLAVEPRACAANDTDWFG
ncbi:MAG: response regulator [Nitrospira sp.]|nr:response regulator [Nitrospira sp.]MBX3332992.1 response regulator [Nitrospira sp.]MDR4462832.1 response regulator [Nitrospira sp.]MDR4468152.1 response regulator [Nitrospira sp.]